jgi:hypothetical protein
MGCNLKRARAKELYRSLALGPVEETRILHARYDLIVMCLVDEHLAALGPVYQEAYRLSDSRAQFVVVGMHPSFFMTGMPTHFKDAKGNSNGKRPCEAALDAGWTLTEMYEGVIGEEWLRVKPKRAPLRNHPVNFGYVWKRLCQRCLF